MRFFELPTPPTTPKSTVSRMSICSETSDSSALLYRDRSPTIKSPKKGKDKDHRLATLSKWSGSTPNLADFKRPRIQSMLKSIGFKSRMSVVAEAPPSPPSDSPFESWTTAASPASQSVASLPRQLQQQEQKQQQNLVSPFLSHAETNWQNRYEPHWENQWDPSLENSLDGSFYEDSEVDENDQALGMPMHSVELEPSMQLPREPSREPSAEPFLAECSMEDEKDYIYDDCVDSMMENSLSHSLEHTHIEPENGVIEWAMRVPISQRYIREILVSNGQTFYRAQT